MAQACALPVRPLEAYTRLYDRTFRQTFWKRGADRLPWRNTWGPRDEIKLAKLKAERKRLRDSEETEQIDALIASYEERRLLQGPLADIDRPGPLSDDMRRASKVVPSHRIQWPLRLVQGATFLLPLRGTGPGSNDAWQGEVSERLAKHRRRRRMAQAPLTTFVALDIAVRGESVDGKDLDNLAHSILVPFERAFCVRPGTVVCNRAYRAVGFPEGVQVGVLNEGRILQLEATLGETRAKST